MRLLQKIVACQDIAKIDAAQLAFFDPRQLIRFFDKAIGAQTKLCALKAFIGTYQTSKEDRLRPKNSRQTRPSGTFGVQKQYVRRYAKAEQCPPVRKEGRNHLAILPDARRKGNVHRFMRTTKPTATLPPFDHDMTITRRVTGKFVLNIPCSIEYTRRPPKAPQGDRVISVDPGIRTFAAVYDATAQRHSEVGIAADRDRIFGGLMQRVDVIQTAVERARALGHRQLEDALMNRSLKTHYRLRNLATNFHARLSSQLVTGCRRVVLGDYAVGKKRANDPGRGMGTRTLQEEIGGQGSRNRLRGYRARRTLHEHDLYALRTKEPRTRWEQDF